jgi:hypothetical protein
LTRDFCRLLRPRRYPMYWPWSLRLARRAGESLSFRPRRPGEAVARDAPSSAGARRPNERTIDPSALRID